jgi:hypothetical protein
LITGQLRPRIRLCCLFHGLRVRLGRGLFPGLQAMSIGFMIDAADPDGNIAKVYKQIARRIAVKVADMAQDHSAAFPKIVVQNT